MANTEVLALDWRIGRAILARQATEGWGTRVAPSSLPILAAQRVDAAALAKDAEQRGWIDEAERHHQLIARLDALITETEAQTG